MAEGIWEIWREVRAGLAGCFPVARLGQGSWGVVWVGMRSGLEMLLSVVFFYLVDRG